MRRRFATILMSYPQVTDVGSELGRPDDGTDPTGFFNVEFYVGLQPYKDKTWKNGFDSHQGRIDGFDSPASWRPIRASSSTLPSPPKTPWTKP